MTAKASVGDAHTKGQFFDDSGSQIGLYLIDGVAWVVLTLGASVVCDLLGQITRSRWPVHVASAQDDHVRKLLVQNIHRSACCVARSAVLLSRFIFSISAQKKLVIIDGYRSL